MFLQKNSAAAITGFLRDSGFASVRDACWVPGTLSSKIVLLNNLELTRLGVTYERNLLAFEDVHISCAVQRAGGTIMKSCHYSFRAQHGAKGGAQAARSLLKADGSASLMAVDARNELTTDQLSLLLDLEAWRMRCQTQHPFVSTRKRQRSKGSGSSSSSSSSSS